MATNGNLDEKSSTLEDFDSITDAIIFHAIRLHVRFGPGLVESFYEAVLARSLARYGFSVERQRAISFEYDGMVFDNVCRVDLLVDNRVVVELKSVERIDRVHPKQLLTYLRAAGLPLGLLINFGAPKLKDGLIRVVNGFDAPTSRLRVNQSGPRRA